MLKCKVCGNPVSPGMAYCPSCGADVIRSYEAKCPKCGTINPAGSRFCATCGTILESLRKPKCAICGAENMPGAKYCVSCGAPIVMEEDTHSTDDFLAMQKVKRSLDILEKERLEEIDKEIAKKRAEFENTKEAFVSEMQERIHNADDELNKKAELLDEYRMKLNELGPEDVAQLKKLSQALKSYAIYYSDPSSAVSDESYEGQTYVCPVCGTINPQDIAACTHCGRNKARSIILLNKGKISQAKAVKRKIDIIKAPQADVSPDPNPTFAEFAQGKFEPVDMDTEIPTPSAQMPQTNMPYGAPGMQNGGQNIGFNNYPQGNPYMYYGRDPYQMPPILQPVAFVPYVTQEQPLMQYTPADSYNKQKVTVKPLEQNGQNTQSNGAKEVKPDDSEI